ncbi:MAG: translocation/assembly module TamB domain-containing protein, partial [Polyangiaceae bacterium]|nr:translocation/assembly module TamB domain-containing protein [Polyangiaceae bacterium]
DIKARVRFAEGGRVVLEELRARDLEGRLTMKGEARFDGLVPREGSLDVQTRRFPIRQAGIIVASIGSRGTARIARDEKGLEGSLRFESLTMRIPDTSRGGVQDLAENPDIVYVDSYPVGWEPPARERPEQEAPADSESFIAQVTPVRFRIDASEPFWVRSDTFSVQLGAQLDLTIDETRASITGEVKTFRGFVELVGTRFEVDEGTIRLTGGETLDPLLDVTARANSGTAAEVRVQISGHLSEPTLGFFDRSGQELTAGAALSCITGSECGGSESMRADASVDAEALTQQARGALASVTAGLLTTAARAGFGERVPRISVSAGEDIEDVTVRAGFQANRLIPEIFRGFVKSLYIEGYVGSESGDGDTARAQGSSSSTRATGGFLIELRHPRSLVSRGRYEPPASWSLDMTWQP